MKQMCCFVWRDGYATCSKCGFSFPSTSGPVYRHCDALIEVSDESASQHVTAGLGDMVAAGLSAIGITKERVSAVVGGDCGCKKRQEALNNIGRKFGIG